MYKLSRTRIFLILAICVIGIFYDEGSLHPAEMVAAG